MLIVGGAGLGVGESEGRVRGRREGLWPRVEEIGP